LARSGDASLKGYFAHQFPEVPRSTIAALRRRISALFSAASLRLALSGTTAPDFRELQDQGAVILVNCFGDTITRSVRRSLLSLTVRDIGEAVFRRKHPERAFVWLLDESQEFFSVPVLHDALSDLLARARSLGSFFTFLTQSISTAVPDGRMLKNMYTNIRWSFSMRG